jgi:hypothetical protein
VTRRWLQGFSAGNLCPISSCTSRQASCVSRAAGFAPRRRRRPFRGCTSHCLWAPLWGARTYRLPACRRRGRHRALSTPSHSLQPTQCRYDAIQLLQFYTSLRTNLLRKTMDFLYPPSL